MQLGLEIVASASAAHLVLPLSRFPDGKNNILTKIIN